MTNAANKITAPEGIEPPRTLLVTSLLLGVADRAVVAANNSDLSPASKARGA